MLIHLAHARYRVGKHTIGFIMLVVAMLLAQAQHVPVLADDTPNATLAACADWQACRLAYAPDGLTLAVASASELSMWDTITGERKVTVPFSGPAADLQYLADGTALIVVSQAGEWLRYSPTLSEVTPYTHGYASFRDMDIAPSGMMAIIAGNAITPTGAADQIERGSIWLIDLNAAGGDGTVIGREYDDTVFAWRSVSFDPTGRYLAAGADIANYSGSIEDTGNNGRQVYVWDVQALAAEPTRYDFTTPFTASTQVRFSSDGLHILSAGNHLTAWDVAQSAEPLYRSASNGLSVGNLVSEFESSLVVAGTWAVTATQLWPEDGGHTRVTVYFADTGDLYLTFRRGDAPTTAGGGGTPRLMAVPLAIRADGTQVAAADPDGTISLWDIPQPPGPPSTHEVFAYCDTLETRPDALEDVPFRIVWRWYATELSLIDQHLSNVEYSITFNGEPIYANSTSSIRRDERNDGAWTVYYYADMPAMPAGEYTITYRATWRNPISDGVMQFGPNTDQPQNEGTCALTVTPITMGA
jgi:WD40 repeat protein